LKGEISPFLPGFYLIIYYMFKKVFSGAAIMLLPAAVLAQFSITGKVTDADNQQALSGATITLNGRSTTSDEQGVFRFNRVREGDDQLKVSFIGYRRSRYSFTKAKCCRMR
jgi:iron complex outermembrane receptor protein